MNIPNETVCYFLKQNIFSYLLVLSNLQGWGILKCCIYGSFYNKNFDYYYKKSIQESIFILGFYKNYTCFLKLKGMGFKSVVVNKNLIFKLGCSHRIIYVLKKNLLVILEQKYLIQINTRCLNKIKNAISIMKSIKLTSSYKIKGIFIKGSYVILKISSKKSKF
jgi:hypothetical protein